jgi:hypothetical protein
MNDAEWSKVRRDKDAFRQTNANRPFAEKLVQLDRLRERSQAMKAGRLKHAMVESARTRGAPQRDG